VTSRECDDEAELDQIWWHSDGVINGMVQAEMVEKTWDVSASEMLTTYPGRTPSSFSSELTKGRAARRRLF